VWRLVKGDFDKKTENEMSPIEQAGKYKDYGFKNLHIGRLRWGP
jgi:phosphoribosylformimino-5-aminoimidazole carboxamide ribotide isomerase